MRLLSCIQISIQARCTWLWRRDNTHEIYGAMQDLHQGTCHLNEPKNDRAAAGHMMQDLAVGICYLNDL